MATLTGKYRSTNEEVNYKDKKLRETAIPILNEVFGYELISNSNRYGIDLLHTNRKGGVELEWGQWKGHYLNQTNENFNKYTLPFPTFNIPFRKEKYFREISHLISKNNNPYVYQEPDYMFNSFARFNSDFTQFWYLDAEMFLKEGALIRGRWKTDTVTTGDIEDWLCFVRENVDIYNLKDGKWVKEDKKIILNESTYKNNLDGYSREFYSRKN